MGLEVVRAVTAADDMRLAAAVSRRGAGEDVGELAGVGPIGIPLGNDLRAALEDTRPDVLVDFTTPGQVAAHTYTAIEMGVHAVVGTTGLTPDDLENIDRRARDAGVGVLVAPNFALGAVLMIRFAREAARHLPDVEIIELHHDQKLDAPSGTAILTAQAVAAARGVRESEEGAKGGDRSVPGANGAGEDEPSRGLRVEGVSVHSVRLPGLVAHQEVLFGGQGQLLTIRHDSYSRTSFMPGVLLGIRRVRELRGLVYGLEALLFEN